MIEEQRNIEKTKKENESLGLMAHCIKNIASNKNKEANKNIIVMLNSMLEENKDLCLYYASVIPTSNEVKAREMLATKHGNRCEVIKTIINLLKNPMDRLSEIDVQIVSNNAKMKMSSQVIEEYVKKINKSSNDKSNTPESNGGIV